MWELGQRIYVSSSAYTEHSQQTQQDALDGIMLKKVVLVKKIEIEDKKTTGRRTINHSNNNKRQGVGNKATH
jgi:hypothetical protein